MSAERIATLAREWKKVIRPVDRVGALGLVLDRIAECADRGELTMAGKLAQAYYDGMGNDRFLGGTARIMKAVVNLANGDPEDKDN